MRILVISDYYLPDGGPVAPLITSLCEGLAGLGHSVTVLTNVPHYPTGFVPEEWRGGIVRRSLEQGVCVVRVPLPSVDRSRLGLRILQFISFQVGATLAGGALDCDVVLSHSSSLEVWLPFIWFASVRRKPSVYIVYDVYPNVGIRSGVLRHRLGIQIVGALEKSCLMSADRVRVVSRSFLNELIDLGIEESKIRLIYDWVEVDRIKPLPRENSFSQEYGLQGRFVVMYAGNLGHVQGLDVLLDAAALLQDDPDVCFALVGDGSRKVELAGRAERIGLKNVFFVPYQPHERVPEMYAAADVSLISLKAGTAFENLPSKLYSIMASGRAVIAAVDPGSDTWDLVERSKSGMCVSPDSPDELARGIRTLKQDPDLRNRYGVNGRAYALQNHSPDYATLRFEELFRELTPDGIVDNEDLKNLL